MYTYKIFETVTKECKKYLAPKMLNLIQIFFKILNNKEITKYTK